jgi:hypothetical protein
VGWEVALSPGTREGGVIFPKRAPLDALAEVKNLYCRGADDVLPGWTQKRRKDSGKWGGPLISETGATYFESIPFELFILLLLKKAVS